MTKLPVSTLLIAIEMVKVVFDEMESPFFGLTNFEDGMLVVAAIIPIGAGLQDPVLICWPFVMGLSTVRQKLMKLFLDVRDATWPVVGLS